MTLNYQAALPDDMWRAEVPQSGSMMCLLMRAKIIAGLIIGAS